MIPIELKRLALSSIARLYSGRTVHTHDGLKIRIHPDWIMGRVVLRRSYEMQWTSFASQFLEAGDRVVDVGANFGYFTLIMAKAVGNSGKVFAIEPNSEIVPHLKENILLNQTGSCISILEQGVGAQQTRGTMKNAHRSAGLGYTETSDTGDIRIEPLDDVVASSIGDIALIKMDIEGNEVDALKGAMRVLSADNPPVMIVEFNREALLRQGPEVPSEFWSIFNDHKYTPRGLADGRVVPLSADMNGRHEGNYIFVPNTGRYAKRLRDKGLE